MERGGDGYVLKTNQKKMEPAFLVEHQPGRPRLKSSPLDSALGSLSGFLHPGCVKAEMVVIKLGYGCVSGVVVGGGDRGWTYAIRRLKVTPVPVRIAPTRISLRARANVTNLSYLSYMTGTKSMNAERNMPVMETKRAKPVRPAAEEGEEVWAEVEDWAYMGRHPILPGSWRRLQSSTLQES